MTHNRSTLGSRGLTPEESQEKLLPGVLDCHWPKVRRRGAFQVPTLRYLPPD
jgi:hypothetical protein